MSAEVNNVAEIERLKELLQEQKAENSVLKGKVAQLQNERDSLTTVIRILNEESNKSEEEELSLPTKSACKSASSSPETGHDNGAFKKVEKKKKRINPKQLKVLEKESRKRKPRFQFSGTL